ncbi:cell division protein FtsL [Brevundimonas aurifodinae]|uniref:Cell division protein n=2 Tax=Brevundimonas TaxID=41275 RepID=A0ABV1NRX4_9CAUL|nr:MAG: cell division protein [Brevundimonas sp. 12-68-7]OYX33931.1 MAG: cell division protein [Brevundimonas subvibrioides]
MTRNPVQRLFDWKVRGIRWIEIIGVLLVAAMIFSVYVAKAAAARESAEIGRLEREIAETRQRVRLLRAEAARLEQPARLEALSRGVGLAPVEMDRRAEVVDLAELKPAPESVAALVEVAPVVTPSPEASGAASVEEGLR